MVKKPRFIFKNVRTEAKRGTNLIITFKTLEIMKTTLEISILNDNARTLLGENINLHEAGLDGLYTVEEITEYLADQGLAPYFEDFQDQEDQEEKINALLHLKELAENGDIYHDIYTGEEWLGINGEGKILLGRGDATDWGKYKGEPENTEEWFNEKNWKPLQENIKLEPVSIPDDGQPGSIEKLCFAQKNTEVSNPVNEYSGWMDDFEMLENSGEYVIVSKKLY